MTITTPVDTRHTDAVRAGASAVVDALTAGAGARSREDWLAVAASTQSLMNTLAAVQDLAVAEVARREHAWAEDGTLDEITHAPGRITLDAADLVAPALGCSHAQAQRRVESAVRIAAGRVPVEAGDRSLPEASGLGALHAAMTGGRLDPYRAGVVAWELQEAPAEVADAVVAALEPHLGADDGPALRRRCRRILHRVSPDLLRQRAARMRAETGLRRWVAEPGVDTWHGTFPSEDAAAAWAAIDRLAHDYVRDGRCTSVEQARGKALTDLVTGHATVEVSVSLTVPVGHEAATRPVGTAAGTTAGTAVGTVAGTAVGTVAGGGAALVQVQGARPSEPTLVPRSWVAAHLDPAAPALVCDPATGALVDPAGDLETGAYRPGERLAALVRARDGRCRFPGCCVAARFCDLDHVRPWPEGPTSAANLLCLCRRHHRVKQSAGWSLRLAPDGTATWTGPMGAVRSTAPRDALESVVLPVDPADSVVLPADPADAVDTVDPADAADAADTPAPPAAGQPPPVWSALESYHEHRLDHALAGRERLRRCLAGAVVRGLHPSRPRAPAHDPPPF